MRARHVYRFLAITIACFPALANAESISITSLPGLQSVSFFETSGPSPNEFVFAVNSPELTTVLSDPLGSGNRDFIGTTFGADENYDVFYSDADGAANILGSFISITADYDFSADSGLNIAGVRLNFADGSFEFADLVASFIALGSLPFPGTVGNAVDGNLNTTTFLGDTVGLTQRLRLTVGFDSTSIDPIPLPAAFPLFAGGLGMIGLFSTRKKRKRA